MLILWLHPDFALELVVFRKYCYHRNLTNVARQSQFIKLCWVIPFLSGQISSKYFRSSDGRTLSIGTQYLKSKSCEFETLDDEKYGPYRVQSITQSPLTRLTTDKTSHNLQLSFISSFESARVVENISAMTWKRELVFDVMLPTLCVQDRQDHRQEG
jgi:hypothetical protein